MHGQQNIKFLRRSIARKSEFLKQAIKPDVAHLKLLELCGYCMHHRAAHQTNLHFAHTTHLHSSSRWGTEEKNKEKVQGVGLYVVMEMDVSVKY
jgi:hypothetical protein